MPTDCGKVNNACRERCMSSVRYTGHVPDLDSPVIDGINTVKAKTDSD